VFIKLGLCAENYFAAFVAAIRCNLFFVQGQQKKGFPLLSASPWAFVFQFNNTAMCQINSGLLRR